jgi:hypothetical protein
MESTHAVVAMFCQLQNGIAEPEVGYSRAIRNSVAKIVLEPEMTLIERHGSVEFSNVECDGINPLKHYTSKLFPLSRV